MANKKPSSSGKEPKNKKNRVLINGIWYWRFYHDGKAYTGRTKEAALAKIEAAKHSNKLTADKSLRELIEWWIDAVYMKDSSIKDQTKTLHLRAFDGIFKGCTLLNERIDNIKGADLQKVFSSSTVAGTSQRHCRSFLSRFYRYAIANGLTSFNAAETIICDKPKRKREDQEIEVFTDEEIRLFISKTPIDHRLRLLVLLAIYTGARIGELLALTYDDFKGDTITINKALNEIKDPAPKQGGKKTVLKVEDTKTPQSIRTIPLDMAIFEKAIKDHRRWHNREMIKNNYRTNYVFTTASGSLYYKSSVRTQFNRLCKLVGVKTSGDKKSGFHKFRRTFGTRCAEKGVAIEVTSKMMGHKSVAVTSEYYIGISADLMRDAIKKAAY